MKTVSKSACKATCWLLSSNGMPWQVIWAALFALAVLVREGSTPHSPALRAIAAAGVLPILEAVLKGYKVGFDGMQSYLDAVLHATSPYVRGIGNNLPS